MLRERSPDELLEHLETCGESYANAKRAATYADWAHTRAKAAAYTMRRAGGGISVEDAKARALDDEVVADSFTEMIDAELARDRAYLKLERARSSIELWRTEAANLRRV